MKNEVCFMIIHHNKIEFSQFILHLNKLYFFTKLLNEIVMTQVAEA